MAKTSAKDSTVEEKLQALYDLQVIDSKIDRIRTIRGELPLEEQDLEDEVAGLQTRITKSEEAIETLNKDIHAKKNQIEDSKAAIKKYTEQQKNVRNNREYDSLTKEIEFQNLEIELAEKRIREFQASIENKQEALDLSNEKLEQTKKE